MATMLLAILAALSPQEISAADKKKIDAARAAFEKAPEDPKAAFELGRLLAGLAGQWEEAIPLLLKSGDKDWAAAAEKDLVTKDTAFHSVEAADAWLAIAAKQKPFAVRLKERALMHFAEAWPKTEPGPTREIIRGKLRSLQAKGPESKALGAFPPGGWSSTNRAGADREFAHSGATSVKVLAGDPKVKSPQSFFIVDALCQPDVKVSFSMWVLTSGGESGMGRVHLKFRNDKQGAGEHLAMHTITVNPDLPIWTQLSNEVVAPAGTVKVELAFGFGGAVGGAAWVDDVSMKFNGREQIKNGSFDGK